MDNLAIAIYAIIMASLLLLPPSLGSRQNAVARFLVVVGAGFVATAGMLFVLYMVR